MFESFYQKGLMSADLCSMTKEEIVSISGRSLIQIEKFLQEFEKETKHIFPQSPQTGLELRRKEAELIQFDVPVVQDIESDLDLDDDYRIPTDTPERNNKLINIIGGLPLGSITEITGQSSVGKSHFLMQLSATVQMRYSKRHAIYISTEKMGLATGRLTQIVERVNRNFQLLQLTKFLADQKANDTKSDESTFKPRTISTDNILTFKATDGEELLHVLQYQVPLLIERHDVGLLVIDSIVAPFRGLDLRRNFRGPSFDNDEIANVESFVEILNAIRSIAHRRNVAIVMANQVKDRVLSMFNHNQIRNNSLHPPYENNLQTLAGISRNGEIQSLMADNQIRWYSGWTNVFLATKGIRYQETKDKIPFLHDDEFRNKLSLSGNSSPNISDSKQQDAMTSNDSMTLDAPIVKRAKLASFYSASDPSLSSKKLGKSPSLGLYLTELIDQRIVLKRGLNGNRYFQVVFSPWSSGRKGKIKVPNSLIKKDKDQEDANKQDISCFQRAVEDVIPLMAEDPSIDPTKEVVEYQIYSGGIHAL